MKFLFIWFGVFCSAAPLLCAQDDQSSSTESPDDNVCSSIVHSNRQDKFNILCVGQLANRLILITTDYFVYDLPLDSLLQSAIKQIYLKTDPIPMADKWPTLWNDRRFGEIKNIVYNAFTFTDDGGNEYVSFTIKREMGGRGVKYNIKTDQVTSGFDYSGDDEQVLLSTTERSTYYAVHRKDADLEISTWRYFIRYDSGEPKIVMDERLQWRKLCKQGDSDPKVVSIFTVWNSAPCPSGSVDWPVLKGFVNEQKVYLFGSSYIYILNESVITRQDQQSDNAFKVAYGDFFRCKGDTRGLLLDQTGEPFPLWIIALIVLLLLILLLLLLGWVVSYRKRKAGGYIVDPSHKPKKAKKLSKKPAKAGANNVTTRSFFTPATGSKSKSTSNSAFTSMAPKGEAVTGRSVFAAKK